MNKYYFYCGKDAEETKHVVFQHIKAWIYSDEFNDILLAFGGKRLIKRNLQEDIEYVLTFSECWDYRAKQKKAKDKKTGEAARWLLEEEQLNANQIEVVSQGVCKLGLTGIEKPLAQNYDYILALGGARYSCLYRPRYAVEIINKYGMHPKALIMLSAMRLIADSEREAVNSYAEGANTEFDLINTGIEKAAKLSRDYSEEVYHNENPNKSWAIRRYDKSIGNTDIYSISGPSTEPLMRRANTGDTYQFLMERLHIKPQSRILLITSQIYVPYQQLEAVRILGIPYNVYVETIGFPGEWNSTIQGMMQTVNYLQEIRSVIQSIAKIVI